MQEALDSNKAKIISSIKKIYFLSFNSMPFISTKALHSHILHYRALLHGIEFGGGGTLHGYKVIAQAYKVNVIESLRQRFPNLKLFNATKLFSSIYFLVDLTLLYQKWSFKATNFC